MKNLEPTYYVASERNSSWNKGAWPYLLLFLVLLAYVIFQISNRISVRVTTNPVHDRPDHNEVANRIAVEKANKARIAKGIEETSETEFEKAINSIPFEQRVKIWAEQFNRSEDWIRRHVSPTDSEKEANAKLVKARLQEEWPVEQSTDLSRGIDEMEQQVEALGVVARQRLNEINRKPGQPGYSLEARKSAALTTLMSQGYSEAEAIEMIDAMVRKGLLPDPPRR